MKDHRGIYLLLTLTLLGGIFFVGFFILQNHGAFPLRINAFSPKTDIVHTEPAASTPAGKRVNINTATAEQLQTLPGIGPGLAQKILAYRAKNGPFASVAELTEIDGIGINRLKNLLEYITTGA